MERNKYTWVVDLGDGYIAPDINLFVDGFEYERTDGMDWFTKVYDKFQENDVRILLLQNRIRVMEN